MTWCCRRPTRGVRVGELHIGDGWPILIQSMATADTLATEALVRQIAELARAGCPLVRVAVPHLKAAENLPAVRSALRREGTKVALVADVHFTPAAALVAADHVEKVRINPGNYADRKRFAVREYSDREYAEELERICERFRPLVLRLKENGVALRIGTNHGSLSDRIVNRYGDTPEGMVESALEFVRICRSLGYHDIVLSMKASVASVMVTANRMLAHRMAGEGMDYPIHLGLTEAGAGIEGRVKSAIGIGTLLLEGIGDTIRVSLAEDPVHEIEACHAILRAVERQTMPTRVGEAPESAGASTRRWEPPGLAPPARRATRSVAIGAVGCGGKAPPRVEVQTDVTPWDPGGVEAAVEHARALLRAPDPAAPLAVAEILSMNVPPVADPEPFVALQQSLAPEYPTIPSLLEWDMRTPGAIHALEPFLHTAAAIGARVAPPVGAGVERIALLARLALRCGRPIRFRLDPRDEQIHPEVWPAEAAERATAIARICAEQEFAAIAFLLAGPALSFAARAVARALDAHERTRGIPLFLELPADPMDAATVGGSLLIDGTGDGILIAGVPTEPLHGPSGLHAIDPVGLAYTILQGCRLRLTRAEFIACPSCGRTQFDLQRTTRQIQERTAHLRGVKIAIMGCIVNGPGEMADADFGYVGSAPGRVDLYVGRTRLQQAIPEEEAALRLIDLIRERGMWVDPPEPQR